jgi:hypothetical protein
VDDFRSTALGLHHPTKPDRVALRHVRALNDNAVRILQILLESCGSAASE